MTTITSGNKEFLPIPLNEGEIPIRIRRESMDKVYLKTNQRQIELPNYLYKIIGLCSEIMKSEELAKDVIEVWSSIYDEHEKYFNYMFRDEETQAPFFYSIKNSFASFMTKHSLTESTLLIEKI